MITLDHSAKLVAMQFDILWRQIKGQGNEVNTSPPFYLSVCCSGLLQKTGKRTKFKLKFKF